jgi:acetylornithine/succinyldiaminopimelate/putrescine aminotransferase
MVLPDASYLETAVRPFQQAGALLVVDEVFTGLHRTGPEFGFQLHRLRPDVVVISKALTNGTAALSAVWAREPLLDAARFPPGTHSSTFAGTPLTLALATVVLERLADGARWRARTAQLQARLELIVQGLVRAFPGLVRSAYAKGAVARVVFERPIAARVRQAALQPSSHDAHGVRGILVASTGMAPDVVALHPPLTIDQHDLDAVGVILHAAINDAAQS